MKLQDIGRTSIAILGMMALSFSARAQESVLPRPFEVYGGTIGTIDAIQVPGAPGKTRVFASTDSANSVFYADVDHSSPAPFGTNFAFAVVPDLDANANFGAPNWIAAHQQSGKIFAGTSSGLVSCTTSSGSLTKPIPAAVSFVLIQGSSLFAVSDAVDEMAARTLYYGSLDSSGSLSLGAPLSTSFYGNPVTLAVSPVDNKVYVLCTFQTNCVLLKSSDNYNAFNAATTFSPVLTTAVTLESASQVAVGPDGRLFLGGGSTWLEMAYSDSSGASWTNFNTGKSRSGGGSGLNIVCNGVSNAYEVYYGWIVSTNKGTGTNWAELPRGGFRPNATHVNAGCVKVDPLDTNMIYVTTDKGIGGSTNAGVDIVELNNGLLAFQINDIDALANKTVAWIGSKAGLRIATNFNSTPVWTDGEFPDAIVYACTIDSDNPSGMTGYAGSSRLYKTITGGGSNFSSWVQVFRWEDYGLGDGEIRSVKAKGSFVALGYYSYSQNSPSGGVYISTTGGTNWEAVITNINVNDMLVREENDGENIYVAVSKSTPADRGGVYRLTSSSIGLDMTNDVNIRKMAEDSVGGIYASGTLPETSMPGRHSVVAYYRDTNSTWNMLTTNGLPGDFGDGDVLGRGLGPVITVGKDNATNDVPVLAVQRTVYYLPYGGSSWVTVTNYPNGTQIKTLFYDELMVGTTIGLYGQGLNAVPAQSARSLTGDIDGDRLADLITVVDSNWYVWFSTAGYQVRSGPFNMGISGTPVTGDVDGDCLADLIIVDGFNWYVWFSTAGYQVRSGPFNMGISGMPATGDIDGDRLADLITVIGSNWYVWFSTAQYAVRSGPFDMGISGTPATGDIDGDRLVDLISVIGSNWYVWFSTAQYQLRSGPFDMGIAGSPVTGDVDGDRLADLFSVVGSNWYVWFSTSQYLVRCGPFAMTAP